MIHHRRLISLALRHRLLLVGILLAGLLLAYLIITQASLLSTVISQVFLQHLELAKAQPTLTLLLIVVIVRAVALFSVEYLARSLGIRVKQGLRGLLVDKITSLGPAYTTNEASGELSNTLTEGIESLDTYFTQFLPQVILAAILPVLVLFAAFPRDLLTGVVLLVTAPILPIFMALIGSLSNQTASKRWQTLSRLSAHMLDTIQGLVTLKMLGQSQKQAARLGQVGEEYRKTTLEVLRVTFLSALVLELVATLSTAIIAVEIGLRLLYAQMDYSTALFLLILAPEFYLPVRNLALRFHAASTGVQAARRIFAILLTPDPEPAQPRQNGSTPQPASAFPLAIDGVQFTYPGRELPALHGISFTLHPGEQVALVGPTGAGKSTLFNLLLGFYQPQAGRISAGGVPMADFPIETWRSLFSWVPQQPFLLYGSIEENLLLAHPGASRSDMVDALQQAGLDDFLSSLPDGLSTPIGEGGARLSSGQAQRLSLARAFLKPAPVILLDEPTSHVDPVLEQQLANSCQRLMNLTGEGHSILTIAHRLNTVQKANRILVMENGVICEQGSHQELLRANQRYASLLTVRGGGI